MPPTPPPDIDLELWAGSEDRILAWDPDTLFLTHFGPFHGARVQFQQLRENIESWNRIVRRLIADPGLNEQQRQDAFVAEALRELRRAVGEAEADQVRSRRPAGLLVAGFVEILAQARLRLTLGTRMALV